MSPAAEEPEAKGSADSSITDDAHAALVEDAVGVLRSLGERITGPRRSVLSVLAGRQDHISADAVFEEVTVAAPTVARSSVYRALETLSDAGIVTHVHTGHGPTVYHLATIDNRHLHVECRKCGVIIDVPGDLLDDVAVHLRRLNGFVLDADHSTIAGICTPCSGS